MPAAAAIARIRSSDVAERIRATRLIAILRRVEPQERLLDLAADLAHDGVRVVEITMDAPSAAADIAAVRRRLSDAWPDAIVGAGTVRTRDQLRAAIDAGAAFAVAPSLDVDLVTDAVARGLPFIPGAYSPTEIDAAWRAGAAFVKLFPASSLGPTHARELRGPFPDIECIATGGVGAADALAFLDAGCVAVGLGGALVRASSAERTAMVRTIQGRR
jgi:2-dehydro-3-deoxyphosphogluconate aldolase/(4S)-4-hydroxy-2-oxoglutarate aldolase